VSSVLSFLPASAQQIVLEQTARLIAKGSVELSANLGLGFAISLWSSNAALKSVIEALNIIFGVKERRSMLALNAFSLAVSAVIILIAILLLLGLSLLVAPASNFESWIAAAVRSSFVKWLGALAAGSFVIAFLFRILPSRPPVTFAWVAPGAIASACLWATLSVAFSRYVSGLADYNATYGSLAVVVVFMTWLWLSATALLLGACLNAELEKQTRVNIRVR
jgi:membrane protein